MENVKEFIAARVAKELKNGDVVRIEIEGIGILENVVEQK